MNHLIKEVMNVTMIESMTECINEWMHEYKDEKE